MRAARETSTAPAACRQPLPNGTRFAAALLAGLLGVATTVSAYAAGDEDEHAGKWIALWTASAEPAIDPFVNYVPPATLNGQTIREVVRTSAGATRLRIRLTNEFTGSATVVGSVHVAVSAANGVASSATRPGTDRVVTFGGEPGVTVAPNAPALSDPVDLPVPALTSLAVSIYIAHGSANLTPHQTALATSYIVNGDQTAAPSLPGAATTSARFALSGLDGESERDAATIVAIGDSIVDGYQSTPDRNHRWPDYLAQRLQTAGLRNLGVANEGITNSRLLVDGFGAGVENRFDRDVLSRPGVRYVFVSAGLNDGVFLLSTPAAGAMATAEQIIQGYRRLIARAHERGLLIFGCTLTPVGGSAPFSPSGEVTRQQVNSWIRQGQGFDALADFDAVLRDPSDPVRLLPALDSGDHIHPTDEGYRRLAASIDLGLFEKERR